MHHASIESRVLAPTAESLVLLLTIDCGRSHQPNVGEGQLRETGRTRVGPGMGMGPGMAMGPGMVAMGPRQPALLSPANPSAWFADSPALTPTLTLIPGKH